MSSYTLWHVLVRDSIPISALASHRQKICDVPLITPLRSLLVDQQITKESVGALLSGMFDRSKGSPDVSDQPVSNEWGL